MAGLVWSPECAFWQSKAIPNVHQEVRNTGWKQVPSSVNHPFLQGVVFEGHPLPMKTPMNLSAATEIPLGKLSMAHIRLYIKLENELTLTEHPQHTRPFFYLPCSSPSPPGIVTKGEIEEQRDSPTEPGFHPRCVPPTKPLCLLAYSLKLKTMRVTGGGTAHTPLQPTPAHLRL
jgi:hypothetical protein